MSISRNKLKFEKWDGINIMCSNMHYLQNIMFFVLTYQFSGKVLVSSASPKLPLLTLVPIWKLNWKFFLIILFFKNILKGGKKDDFDINDIEFPMSEFALLR